MPDTPLSARPSADGMAEVDSTLSASPGQLQHPGVAPVYELGALPDGRPFFSMKLVKGRTLAEQLRDRADPRAALPHLLGVFRQVCDTMAYAHAKGVIHRDLKPSNVMV